MKASEQPGQWEWHVARCELPRGFVIVNQEGILAAGDLWFAAREAAEEYLRRHEFELFPMPDE